MNGSELAKIEPELMLMAAWLGLILAWVIVQVAKWVWELAHYGFQARAKTGAAVAAGDDGVRWHVRAGRGAVRAVVCLFVVILLTWGIILIQNYVADVLERLLEADNSALVESALTAIYFATVALWPVLCYFASGKVGLKRWRFVVCGIVLSSLTLACLAIYPWIKSDSMEKRYNANGLAAARIIGVVFAVFVAGYAALAVYEIFS